MKTTLLLLVVLMSQVKAGSPPYYYYMPPEPMYNRPQCPDVMYPAPNGTWVNTQQRHGGWAGGGSSFAHRDWNNLVYAPKAGDAFVVNGHRLPLIKNIDITLSPKLYVNRVSYEHLTAKKRTTITNVTSITLPVGCQKELREIALLYKAKLDKELLKTMTIVTRPGQEPVTNYNERAIKDLGLD